VAFEGPSGVGKTSLVRALEERTGRRSLPEAYDSAADAPSLEFGTRTELRKIERALVTLEIERFRSAARFRARGVPLLLDTGFVGPLTYSMGLREVLGPDWDVVGEIAEEFERAASSASWGIPDLTVYLDAPAAVVSKRARGASSSHPARLTGRHARVASYERTYWLQRIDRAVPGRLVRVSARGEMATTVDRILPELRRAGSLPPPTAAEARAVLRGLNGPPVPPRIGPRSATLKKGTLSPRPPRR
jgi:hypothetical protein